MAHFFNRREVHLHSDWIHANQRLYGDAEAQRASAERLTLESSRTIDDATEITKNAVLDNQKRLEQKITELKHWEKELNISLEDNKKATAAMAEMNKRLNKLMEALGDYLHISQQCLLHREKRILTDVVHDKVEIELLKEVEVVQAALALLTRTSEQAIEQIRLNRKAKYHLDNDLHDKFITLSIDTHNAELRVGSKGNKCHASAARLSGKSITPEQWIDLTQNTLNGAEKQRQNSHHLLQICESVLQSTYNDLERQKRATNDAFYQRIAETRDTKGKLEHHLNKIIRQTVEMEDSIMKLQLAIDNPISKPDALKMTETRLQNRLLRPGNELCRDMAQYSLVKTDQALGEVIAQLQLRIVQSRKTIQALNRQKLELEQELKVKAETLFIDETECMTMRHSISLQCF